MARLSVAIKPMVTGFPLKCGDVYETDSLGLIDERGRQLLDDIQAIARWADGSVKWALASVPSLDVEASSSGQIQLCNLSDEQQASRENVHLETKDRGYMVDTGRLRVSIPAAGACRKSLA